MSRPLVPESELSEMRHKLAQKNEQIESQRSRIEELEFQAQMDRRDIQFLNELVRRIASHMIDINSDNQDLTELVDRLQEKMNELEDECEVAFELLRRNRELWTNFGPLFVLLLQATIDLIESWQDRGSEGEIFNTRAFKDSFMAVMLVTDRIVREMEEKLLFAPQTTIEGMIGRVRVPIIPGGLHVPGEAIGELHTPDRVPTCVPRAGEAIVSIVRVTSSPSSRLQRPPQVILVKGLLRLRIRYDMYIPHYKGVLAACS
jgi:hypothetical protein